MSYIDVASFGARGDGLTDDTAAVQQACDRARGGHLHFSASRRGGGQARYSVSKVSVHAGTRVTADERVAIEARGTDPNGHIFECASSYGPAIALAADAGRGQRRLELSSASGLRPGDVAIVRDDSFKYGGKSGPNLEFVEVCAAAGEVLVPRSRLIGDYRLARSARIVPLSHIARGIRFEGVHCRIGPRCDGGAFYFQDAYQCEVLDCSSDGQRGQPGVQIWRSAFVSVRDGRFTDGQDVAKPGNGYGCNIAQSSHDCWIVGTVFRNVRECAVASNARSSGYIDCESYGSYDNAFNSHLDGSEDCWFIHCTSHDARSKGFCAGATAGWAADKRIHFIGCQSYNSGYMGFWTTGAAGFASEQIRFIDCIAVHPGRSINPSYGFFTTHCSDLRLIDCAVYAAGERNCRAGVALETCRDVTIRGGEIRDVANGWGIIHSDCNGLDVTGVSFTAVRGQKVYAAPGGTPSSGVHISDTRESASGQEAL